MADPRNPALLLLDDDPLVREVLQTRLAAAGHEVIAVARIHDAVQHAKDVYFDCLLIDRHIGGEDGVDALQALRRCDGARGARAIAISADLDDAARLQLNKAGFDACVQKPVAMTQLLAVITGAQDPNSPAPASRSAAPAQILDDAAALAIWGSADTVRQLRAMLAPELDAYRFELQDCATGRDSARLRGTLHRMRSSAGFCGAEELRRFIDATTVESDDVWTDLLIRYDAVTARLKPALQAATAT